MPVEIDGRSWTKLSPLNVPVYLKEKEREERQMPPVTGRLLAKKKLAKSLSENCRLQELALEPEYLHAWKVLVNFYKHI